MSRHNIPTKNPLKYSCVVGYDNPLQTFFAQVIDNEAEEYNTQLPADSDEPEKIELIVWNGCRSGEITSLDKLQETIRDYAILPHNIREMLEREKSNSPGPNAFQKRMIGIVEGLF